MGLGQVWKSFTVSVALIMATGILSADITSGLLAHWQFEEGSGTTVADQSGANRTMTVSTSASTWVSGKYGSGLAGVGDPLLDRSSFDLHGKNISIGKIPGR